MSTFSSEKYWENRYATGGTSGAGSSGRLAAFKAEFINAFLKDNSITSVVDFGCGDGTQLSLFRMPKYTGIDSSPKALDLCRSKFKDQQHEFAGYEELSEVKMAELVLSMDIIFHLVEDSVFEKYMRDVFVFATDFVIFYSSNYERTWHAEHVRHRCVSEHVHRMFPEWALLAHIPNIYPYDAKQPDTTSFSDFLVYGRGPRECRIRIPATTENEASRVLQSSAESKPLVNNASVA